MRSLQRPSFAAPFRRWLLPLLAVAGVALLAGCANIATFDRVAYEKATDAKAAALTAMSRASDSYASQQTAITPLLVQVEEAHEYDEGRAKNSDTVQQWKILLDPEGHLFGRFVQRWQAGKTFTPDALRERKTDVALAFDQIIGLERGKRMPAPANP